MRNHSIATLPKKKHLCIPRVGGQRPTMREDNGLPCSPVFEINRCPVFYRDGVHINFPPWCVMVVASAPAAFTGWVSNSAESTAAREPSPPAYESAGLPVYAHSVTNAQASRPTEICPERPMATLITLGGWVRVAIALSLARFVLNRSTRTEAPAPISQSPAA